MEWQTRGSTVSLSASRELVACCLQEMGGKPSNEAVVRRIADEIRRGTAWRLKWQRFLGAPEKQASMDIVRWIAVAREAGDLDEALWRGFLAGHFGRSSANPSDPRQVSSAGRFLCGFAGEPLWTWRTVSSDLRAFEDWLNGGHERLADLRFGNHRKYESKRPDALFGIVTSFVDWVRRSGGSPVEALGTEGCKTPEEAFDHLYDELRYIRRFGRTAAFDTLILLGEMGLLQVRPASCYLKGATGPLRGAAKLWGPRQTEELGRLAVTFSGCLAIPVEVVEDALCNWQKSRT